MCHIGETAACGCVCHIRSRGRRHLAAAWRSLCCGTSRRKGEAVPQPACRRPCPPLRPASVGRASRPAQSVSSCPLAVGMAVTPRTRCSSHFTPYCDKLGSNADMPHVHVVDERRRNCDDSRMFFQDSIYAPRSVVVFFLPNFLPRLNLMWRRCKPLGFGTSTTTSPCLARLPPHSK